MHWDGWDTHTGVPLKAAAAGISIGLMTRLEAETDEEVKTSLSRLFILGSKLGPFLAVPSCYAQLLWLVNTKHTKNMFQNTSLTKSAS